MARLDQQRRELNRNALQNAVGGQLQRSYEEFVASELPDNLASLLMQLVAFGLFRLFDIWKPFPIRLFEQRLKGGFGVMFDDLVAACYAYLVIIVLVVAAHHLLKNLA